MNQDVFVMMKLIIHSSNQVTTVHRHFVSDKSRSWYVEGINNNTITASTTMMMMIIIKVKQN